MEEPKGIIEALVDNLRKLSLDNGQADENGFTASVGAVVPPEGDVTSRTLDTAAAVTAMGLADLAGGILRFVVCLLEQRDIVSLGMTSRTLHDLEQEFVIGRQAFPLGPAVDDRHGNEGNAVEVDTDTMVCRKTVRPGMGTVLAKERLDLMTCYWEVKIEAFSGVRLEIGVATRRCIRRGGLDKDEYWAFDCYGRARHGSRIRGYGCKVKAGDVIGVLLNTADNSLSFFLHGECMGTAFRNVRAPVGLGLYPLLVLPSVARETVQLLRHPEGDSALFPAPVRELLATKRAWRPRKHEHDHSVIVETYDAQVIHRFRGMDPGITTVGGLKEALVTCQGLTLFTPGQLALRSKGALLTDDSALLSAVGVSFGSHGAQLQDIYLYVPHLIS